MRHPRSPLLPPPSSPPPLISPPPLSPPVPPPSFSTPLIPFPSLPLPLTLPFPPPSSRCVRTINCWAKAAFGHVGGGGPSSAAPTPAIVGRRRNSSFHRRHVCERSQVCTTARASSVVRQNRWGVGLAYLEASFDILCCLDRRGGRSMVAFVSM